MKKIALFLIATGVFFMVSCGSSSSTDSTNDSLMNSTEEAPTADTVTPGQNLDTTISNTQDAANNAQNKMDTAAQKTGDAIDTTKQNIKDAAKAAGEDIKGAAKDVKNGVKDAATDLKEGAKKKAAEAAEKTEEKSKKVKEDLQK